MVDELVLVDASAWVYALRRENIGQIRERIDRLLQVNSVCICPYVRFELLANVTSEEEYLRLDQGLGALRRAELDDECWQRASRLAFTLKMQGLVLARPCVLMAACAARHGATLLHADNSFDQAASFLGCAVESYAYLLPLSR